MNSAQLNKLLITSFPKLKADYDDEVSWQEGDDTGSHVVFGDVLNPVLRKLVEVNDFADAQPYFDFTEKLLESGDDYAAEVATVTIIDSLFYGPGDRARIEEHLGPLSKAVWHDYEAQSRSAARSANQ